MTTPGGGPDDRDRDLEARLLTAARAGDRAAVEELLAATYDRVAVLCRRLLHSPADAEDATQEAMIAVARGLARFDGRSAFSTWVHRIATNVCLDELRRRTRRLPTVDLDRDPATGESVDGAVALRLDLDQALGRLPVEFRVPVVLRDLCGFDYAEIAEWTGAPAGTVRSRIARGRAALRADLGIGPPPGNQDGPADVELVQEDEP